MHGEDIFGFRQIGHHDLGGYGDGMQVMRHGDALYVGHFGPSGMGTTVLDASDPTDLKLVKQWKAPEGGHNHKVQVADGLLITNFEAFRGGQPDRVGFAVFDLSDPFNPREIGFWNSGGRGVHRIVYEGGRYVYLSATPPEFSDRIWVIVDISDPTNPVEAGRWWWPGMKAGEEHLRDWPEHEERSVHHAMVHGDRAYVGFWDSGMAILDISDYSDIKTISHINWEVGGNTHTCLPLPSKNVVVVTDEAVKNDCEGDPHYVRIVDISDEKNPEVIAICPEPEGDFCERGLRFGAHNLHENRPNSYRSEELMFTTYFNGGLRVYDVSDPRNPTDIAHWIPECPPDQPACQINDAWVAEDLLVYVTDRVNGGVYVLEPEDWLKERMRAASL
jgi:hypothetical protein